MDFQTLAHGESLAFVVVGTLLGTALRCGAGNISKTLSAIWRVLRSGFDSDQTKSILAYHAARIRKDGVLRASERSCSDPDIDECIQMLVRRRSVAAMEQVARGKHRAKNELRELVTQTLENAAELAPVFGLAGTLLALSQLPSGGIGAEGLMPTVAMAVQTTLFGLALAHLGFVPLARWLDRRMTDELRERGALLDWFVGQVQPAVQDSSSTVTGLHPEPPRPVNEPGGEGWAA